MTLHQITRVRRDTRRRVLTVSNVEDITPRMRRVYLKSPELADFGSDSYDDHVKLFFATEDQDTGPVPGYHMRDYTPRAFDPAAQSLVIDFALHDAGPATAWAIGAKPGDTLEIGGPRGSAIVPDDFDWYILIGDETALPAIGRRVEELRPGVPVTTIVTIEDASERQSFATRAQWSPVWIERDTAGQDDIAAIQAALAGLTLPAGDGFIFVAAEAQVARATREYLLDTLKHPKEWVKAKGYWLNGDAGISVTLDEGEGPGGPGGPGGRPDGPPRH